MGRSDVNKKLWLVDGKDEKYLVQSHSGVYTFRLSSVKTFLLSLNEEVSNLYSGRCMRAARTRFHRARRPKRIKYSKRRSDIR